MENYKVGQWFKFIEEFGLYDIEEPVEFTGRTYDGGLQLRPPNWDGGGSLGWTPPKYVQAITDEEAQEMIDALVIKKISSKERYEGFKRIAEDIQSRADYLGINISLHGQSVNANQVKMEIERRSGFNDFREMRCRIHAEFLDNGVSVSTDTYNSHSSDPERLVEFIEFLMIVQPIMLELKARMEAVALRRVVNA